MVEWQTRVLGMALAFTAFSEEQHDAVMQFIEGVKLFGKGKPSPAISKDTPVDDLEEVMSGRWAEAHTRAAPPGAVESLLGHGFIA